MRSSEQPPIEGAPIKAGKATMSLVALTILFVVMFVVGLGPKLRTRSRLAAMAQEASSAAPMVQVVKPTYVDTGDLLLPGSIQAMENTTVSARTSGYVRKRYVDIGSRVKAGQLLAEIESPDVDQQVYQAQAQTAQSEATVGQSQAAVAQQQATVAQAQAQVAQQRASVEQIRAVLASTESKVVQAQAAERETEATVLHANQALGVQRAAKRQAEAQRDLAKVTSERYDSLVKQGFDSQQNADQAAAQFKTQVAAVDSAQAAVQAAEADVQSAQQAVEAAKAVVKSSQADVVAGKKSVTAAEASVSSGRAAVSAAQATVAAGRKYVQANRATVVSNQANTQRYAVMRGFERVVAPFDGVITSRNIDTGTLINAGSTDASGTAAQTTPRTGLFGIARTDTLRIDVTVPESGVRFIKQGLEAIITVTDYPGRKFIGKVYQTSGALDSTSRTLLTEVEVENRDNALKPGMYARIALAIHGNKSAPHIAANTLIVDAKGVRVATVTTDNKIHFVPIEIGRDLGSEVEVTSGLKGDEMLVTDPSDDLVEGETVTVDSHSGAAK